MTRLGVGLRLFAVGLLLALILPPHLLALRFGWAWVGWAPLVFHRAVLRLFGVRVVERGTPPGPRIATLVLANHVSWLDILVIGSLHPLSFIAKAEVEGWPAIGFLARLQRTVFIDRQRRRATAEVNHLVAHRLRKGEVIVLFAEGTTGDGNHVLPFRSSLVGAAQAALADSTEARIHLQPLAIAYRRRNGLPVTRRELPGIAWYGDMDLASHLASFVRHGPIDAEVIWGEPMPFAGDRKRATALAEAEVRRAVKAIG
jgi:1-acyl-sn-glycerol-3-phosphate acyltransferase